MTKRSKHYTAIINNEELLFKQQEVDEDLYTYNKIIGSQHVVIVDDFVVTLKLKQGEAYVLEYQDHYMGITYSKEQYSNIDTKMVTCIRDYVSLAVIMDK